MHRRKAKSLAEQFETLDMPAPAEAPVSEPLELLDEPERPAVAWPVPPPVQPIEERRKRSMPITISFVFLCIACLCFVLAAFQAPVSPRVNMLGLGLFFWTLSLLIRP